MKTFRGTFLIPICENYYFTHNCSFTYTYHIQLACMVRWGREGCQNAKNHLSH